MKQVGGLIVAGTRYSEYVISYHNRHSNRVSLRADKIGALHACIYISTKCRMELTIGTGSP